MIIFLFFLFFAGAVLQTVHGKNVPLTDINQIIGLNLTYAKDRSKSRKISYERVNSDSKSEGNTDKNLGQDDDTDGIRTENLEDENINDSLSYSSTML